LELSIEKWRCRINNRDDDDDEDDGEEEEVK